MKQITLENTREELKKGIDILADVVKVTLGGKGKNVIINNGFENVKIINDGVSIAREVEIDDEVQNTGAILAKQAAEKTNDEAGDGTTTTIVLLQAFLNAMSEVPVEDSRLLREKIDKYLKDVIQILDDNKREISDGDIYRIAKNSSLDEDIARTIEEIMTKIGKDGVVSFEDGQKPGISSEIVLGVKIDDGYLSPYFITDAQRLKVEIKDAPVLLSKKHINSVKDILPILEALQSRQKNEIVIFVEEMADDVLATLVVNKMQGRFNACVVRTRNMEDIATVTGATIVSEEAGHSFSSEMLGWADRVEVGKNSTIVTGGREEQEVVDEKIKELKEQRENVEGEYEKQVLSERIAKLQGGVSVIKIAGDNDQQTKERKLKLEDALNAVKSAMDEGVIEGGGVALMRAASQMDGYHTEKWDDQIAGRAMYIVLEVIMAPIKQILINADENVDEVISSLEKNNKMGYNVIERKLENFYESGIIDPVKVIKSALKNAFAMGTSIMTAEAGVIIKSEKK